MSTELSEKIASRIDKDVASETSLARSGGMDFRNVEQIMNFAKLMAVSQVAIPKHLRDNPGACLAVAIQAGEWKMSPFAVANKSYVVNDRLAYEAQLVNAVILRRAPIIGRFKISYSGEGIKRRCKVEARLYDGSGETVEYESPEIDKIPVKNSPLWQSDPDQQLFYYSSRAMCRRHFPDVILGIYTADELEDAPPMERSATGREVKPARIPDVPLLPEKKPYTPATAQEHVGKLAADAGVEMSAVVDTMVALEIIPRDSASSEVTPSEWAQAESQWKEILAELEARA